MTLILNKNFTDNNDTATTATTAAHTVVAATVESLTIKSTGVNTSLPFTAVDGYKADTITNTLTLTGSDAVTGITVTGDQALVTASTAAMTKLATIDGSANTGGLTFSGAAADMTTPTTSAAMTIKGSATAANTLTGSGHADTIIGGAKADTITGGLAGDTMTGNGGNDKFVISTGESTIAAGNADTITDFVANTYGAGASGLVTSAGANGVAATSLTGDTIQLHNAAVGASQIITVGVYTNAADATTFLQTQSATEGIAANQSVHAALNSTTGDLYVDIDGNGTADLYIHLTGVTTLTAAAFLIV
jgi:Ca2+-binding RTX toxin-like protein